MSGSNKAVHPFFQQQLAKRPQPKKLSPDPPPTTKSSPDPPPTPYPTKQDRSKCHFHKGQSSTPHHIPMNKPKFYSDSLPKLEQEEAFTFYGKKPAPPSLDFVSEFSLLSRDLFHVTNKPFEPSSFSPPRRTIDFSTLMHSSMQPRPRKMRLHSNKPFSPPLITNQQELEAYLNLHFPHWNTFPSCCLLSQNVWRHDATNKPWSEKYRPKHLNGLVGARYNFLYLRDWLHQMKIEPLSAPATKDKNDEEKKKKSKRKKQKKIVVHDEYADEDSMLRRLSLQEDEDDDDFRLTPYKKKPLKKTTMKSNIILLVGDSGVGKTAAVYTIAEQLHYQVFEINAGSKRSGKEIVSMVGEMTKSHLVRFQAPVVPSIFSNTTKNSKKKKLKPTFAPSAAQLPSQEKKRKTDGLLSHFSRVKEPESKKQPVNNTQQSLILLEEVDLLFEEDKGFWASVIDLSQKSKRPIVMTCNDPDQVPFEDLCIQSVLDFQPPSDNELLPYLWLVCFTEGYIVDPKDLMCLMAFLGRDIRQLLQTLELYAGERIFERYLGLSDDMDLVEMKPRCPPSRLAVDTFRLARFYEGEKDDDDEEEDDFEVMVRAVDNNAFMDSYMSPKDIVKTVTESMEDQLSGFTALCVEENEDSPSIWTLNEIENQIYVMNSQLLKTTAGRKFIMDESSHWLELCEANLTTFEDSREAIEKLLPTSLIYQPNEETIMMDYIPRIQMMISTNADQKSGRSTRSKRKRLYLPLNEDCVDTLIKDKSFIDETDFWIQRMSNSTTL